MFERVLFVRAGQGRRLSKQLAGSGKFISSKPPKKEAG